MNPDILHKHMIVRAEILNPFSKNDIHATSRWIEDLVKKLNMKILSGPHTVYCTKKGNMGITSFTIIETSHICIHIWDEISPAILQFDVYTCSELNENVVLNHLEILKPIKVDWKYIDRQFGLNIISDNIIKNNLK